jgi:hypothetical protein
MALLPTNEPNPWAFYAIFRAAPRIVEKLGLDPHGIRIYAMSGTNFYTEFGPRSSTQEKLLRRLGFEVVSENTAQHLTLFGADLDNVVATSRDLIKNIEARKNSVSRNRTS